jgi:hypothetical protein
MLDDGAVIDTVPAGTRVLAKSDRSVEWTTRLVLFQLPTGEQYWLHANGSKEWLDC